MKATFLLKKLLNSRFHEIGERHGSSTEITGIFSHTFFRKNFVKAMDLLNTLLNSSFDEFFLQWGERISCFPHCIVRERERICVFSHHDVDDSEILSHNFGKNFVKVSILLINE